MTPVSTEIPVHRQHARPPVLALDDRRGTWGMALFIATEATLFVMLLFSYYYTSRGNNRWQVHEAPKLHYSLPMLAVLLTSSGVLYWGEQQVKKHRYGAARGALLTTILLGIGFLVLTFLEYSEHLKTLRPSTDAYGSTFYTLTSLHGAHVVFGLLMLCWVMIVPRWEPARRTPHRPYHNVAMYWHFVDTVWLFLVILLYIVPNIYNIA
ncbi:MAG TPA: cytochrome c oxidase subunit 3 [Terriglobales bacterium]|nr:cytochrome c oxidase subunit 3 [Terriglobales bacterium]